MPTGYDKKRGRERTVKKKWNVDSNALSPQKICDCTHILNSKAPFSNNHINTYLDKNTLRNKSIKQID